MTACSHRDQTTSMPASWMATNRRMHTLALKVQVAPRSCWTNLSATFIILVNCEEFSYIVLWRIILRYIFHVTFHKCVVSNVNCVHSKPSFRSLGKDVWWFLEDGLGAKCACYRYDNKVNAFKVYSYNMKGLDVLWAYLKHLNSPAQKKRICKKCNRLIGMW